MKYATVCSGIGAPEAAWADMWGPPEFTSEIEAFPSAVLEHHYPDVPNYGDMTKYKTADIKKGVKGWPDHDLGLICGGTPCQSFSVAGLRKGMDDPRGNLTLTYLGILARYNPRWFIWENVPGVLSSASSGESDFGRFLSALAELGYSCAYRVLDAQFFGVPQRRRRVFVVGYLGDDWRPPYAVLFEPESLRGYTPKGGKEREGVAVDVGGGIKSPSHWDGGPHPPLTQSHNTGGVGGSNQEIFSQRGAYLVPHKANTLLAKSNDSHDASLDTYVMAHGQGNAEICKDGAPSLTCNHEAPIVCNARQDPITIKDKALPLDVKGNTQAIAIRTAQTKANGHGVAIVRRLTPRECERLQGFPDNYTLIPVRRHKSSCAINKDENDGKDPWEVECDCEYKEAPATDGHRYKALGNSMAVPVVRWIGERIQIWEDLKKSGHIK